MLRFVGWVAACLLLAPCCAAADVQTAARTGSDASPDFLFEASKEALTAPSDADAGNLASARLLSGQRDPNGATLQALTDGLLPRVEDDPRRNFFFAGRQGGRILLDLSRPIAVRSVHTYSWHPRERGPQVYSLYGATEDASQDALKLAAEAQPEASGWTKIADVDTRDRGQATGGQYAVRVAGDDGATLGDFRYLLFEVEPTSPDQPFSNTFFSEIDVLDGNEYPRPATQSQVEVLVIEQPGGPYRIEFDMTEVPELREWVLGTLKPTCAEWYPRIVRLLPSEGFSAPRSLRITFDREMDGVAFAVGTEIRCAGRWFLANLEGEAPGAVVHELVHVVQQYGRPRGGQRNPGWMVEGVADYIRWFLYEPAAARPRPNFRRANYDDSYRTTAAFLNYVVEQYHPELVEKFNAAMRGGRYRAALWTELTGKTPEQLWREYAATE